MNWQQIQDELSKIDLRTSVNVVDIYKAENSDTKNITIRVNMVSYDHTLIGDGVNAVIKNVVNSVVNEVKATVI